MWYQFLVRYSQYIRHCNNIADLSHSLTILSAHMFYILDISYTKTQYRFFFSLAFHLWCIKIQWRVSLFPHESLPRSIIAVTFTLCYISEGRDGGMEGPHTLDLHCLTFNLFTWTVQYQSVSSIHSATSLSWYLIRSFFSLISYSWTWAYTNNPLF